MKKIELILGVIAIIGIVLKLFHIPGGAALTILSLLTLSVFYYVFSFALFNGIRLRDIFKKEAYKETNIWRIIGAIVIGWDLSIVIIGGLFKLQSWPGGNLELLIGLVIAIIILIIAMIFYLKNKAEYYKRIAIRIAIYGGLGLVLLLMPAAIQ